MSIAAGLPFEVRIVQRNIERKPVVALLSVAGVALAIMLLIFARYIPDATNQVYDILFNQIEREDATVTFEHALEPAAAFDVASLPGVVRVEPFRSVAARVGYGNVTRRVLITGLPSDGDLRRIVDFAGRRVLVPPNGVLLSRSLAETLRIPKGAVLEIDALEDRRQHLEVRVAGTVDEFVGTSVYCDLNTLGKLLDHQGQISGAFVALDSHLADQFYHAIKRVPAVAGVTLREASMNSFNQVLVQELRLDESMIFLFACVIAFGVAYNTARIALSERAIELSSLRILGFTRAETWRILVGEQFFFMLAAALPGIVAGALFTRWFAAIRSTENYTLPWMLTPGAVEFALLFVIAMTAISALIVRRQVDRLDLVAVLKAGD